jgi:hypothetical protein
VADGTGGELIVSTLFSDTSPQTEQMLFKMMRDMPPWRKLEMVAQLNQAVRDLALIGLRERYPIATPEELRRRLADMILGPELALKVYGPFQGDVTQSENLRDIEQKVNEASIRNLLEQARQDYERN